jgi:hypothetical protein
MLVPQQNRQKKTLALSTLQPTKMSSSLEALETIWNEVQTLKSILISMHHNNNNNTSTNNSNNASKFMSPRINNSPNKSFTRTSPSVSFVKDTDPPMNKQSTRTTTKHKIPTTTTTPQPILRSSLNSPATFKSTPTSLLSTTNNTATNNASTKRQPDSRKSLATAITTSKTIPANDDWANVELLHNQQNALNTAKAASASSTSANPNTNNIVGDVWKEAITSEGVTYYYNRRTRESRWDAPSQYIPLSSNKTSQPTKSSSSESNNQENYSFNPISQQQAYSLETAKRKLVA